MIAFLRNSLFNDLFLALVLDGWLPASCIFMFRWLS